MHGAGVGGGHKFHSQWKTLDMMYRVKIAKLIYNIYYEATYAPMYERPYQETQDKT